MMLKQKDGLIINLSSILGHFSAPFMTVYNSTKFAIEGLTEGLHYELHSLGVDAVLIQPGAFPTQILANSSVGSDQSVVEEYGALADVPAQVGEGLGNLFETLQPNPQLVPDAIFDLIEQEQGTRPLRTVVDIATGSIVEKSNEQVEEQYKQFLTAFGMKDLLY